MRKWIKEELTNTPKLLGMDKSCDQQMKLVQDDQKNISTVMIVSLEIC